MTTLDRTIVRLAPDAYGWRPLAADVGEPRTLRLDLVEPSGAARVPTGPPATPLLAFAHLSDLHLCDHQSPARVPFLDRYADPDWPDHEKVENVGTYRAQEILTAQVAEAMVRSVNRAARGGAATLGIRSPELVVTTGDLTDNAQANELSWYLTLLDGGRVVPDSGDLSAYEGFASSGDPRFWHPEGDVACIPTTKHGFPVVRGLLDAARRPFVTEGLRLPWYSVHGNHDAMVQGTVSPELGSVATGGRALVGAPPGVDMLPFLAALDVAEPEAVAMLANGPWREVSPDAARRFLDRVGFVAAHLAASAGAGPVGHGLTEANLATATTYFTFEAGRDSGTDGGDGAAFRCVVLDTVNPYGGWQGSLDEAQLAWLEGELSAADADQRHVLLFSHHPLETLINAIAPEGVRRMLADDVLTVLHRHPSVVAWFNGHTHTHTVTPFAGPAGGFWQVTTASAIDWPQQWRMVEIGRRDDGLLSITLTITDHEGPAEWDASLDDPVALASLSRVLAANDWQRRDRFPRAGDPWDRNVELLVPDTWPRR